MRPTLIRAIVAAGLAALPLSVHAQTSSQDLLRSLQLPSGGSGTSRGIHAIPAPDDTGTAAPSAGGAPSAAVHPHHRQAAAAPAPGAPGSGEANIYVEFRTGSAQLSPSAMQILNNLGTALSSPQLAGDKFRIEGHTDTVGSPEMNKTLSDQRAAAVVEYLVNTFHLDRGRFESVGLGETDLLVPTPPQTPDARNRRVRVVNLGA